MINILTKYIGIVLLIIVLPLLLLPNLKPDYKDYFKYSNEEYSFDKNGKSLSKNFSQLPKELTILQEVIKRNWNPPSVKGKKELSLTVSIRDGSSQEQTKLNESKDIQDIRVYQTARRAVELSTVSDFFSKELPLSEKETSRRGFSISDGFSGYSVFLEYDGLSGKKNVYIDKLIFWSLNKFWLTRFLVLMSLTVTIFAIAYLTYALSAEDLAEEIFAPIKTENEEIIKVHRGCLGLMGIPFLIAGFDTFIQVMRMEDLVKVESDPLFFFSLIIIALGISGLIIFCNFIVILTNKRVIRASLIFPLTQKKLLQDINYIEVVEHRTVFGKIGHLKLMYERYLPAFEINSLYRPASVKCEIEYQKSLIQDKPTNTQDIEGSFSESNRLNGLSDWETEEYQELRVKYCANCANEVPIDTLICPLCNKEFEKESALY